MSRKWRSAGGRSDAPNDSCARAVEGQPVNRLRESMSLWAPLLVWIILGVAGIVWLIAAGGMRP